MAVVIADIIVTQRDRRIDAHLLPWHGSPKTRYQAGHPTMIKSALVQKLADGNPHLYHQDLERIVNIVLSEIPETLKNGGHVELRGFGSFTTKARDVRMGRNPRTGSAVVVEAKRQPCFRTMPVSVGSQGSKLSISHTGPSGLPCRGHASRDVHGVRMRPMNSSCASATRAAARFTSTSFRRTSFSRTNSVHSQNGVHSL